MGAAKAARAQPVNKRRDPSIPHRNGLSSQHVARFGLVDITLRIFTEQEAPFLQLRGRLPELLDVAGVKNGVRPRFWCSSSHPVIFSVEEDPGADQPLLLEAGLGPVAN